LLIESELEEEEPQTIQKSKRPRTEKQKEAFAKIIEKRTQAHQARAEPREEAIIVKAEIEKLLKKAVSIKKKQIKKQIALDDISIDDESDTCEEETCATQAVCCGKCNENGSSSSSSASCPQVSFCIDKIAVYNIR
jgi:hypothetical protein